MATPLEYSRLSLVYSDYEDYIDILVDDKPLVERLKVVEGATIFDDAGLGWHVVDSGAPHTVFDREALVPGAHSQRLLFMCGCNIAGCWDTIATVTATDTAITLSQFSCPTMSLLAVQPIAFDRAQFIAEVDRTNDWFAKTWPDAHRRKAELRALRQSFERQHE